MDWAVEVLVSDDAPVKDADDDATDDADNALASKLSGASSSSPAVVDQSRATFASHTDAVYAVVAHFDAARRVGGRG